MKFWWWRDDDVFVMVEGEKSRNGTAKLIPYSGSGRSKEHRWRLDCEYCLQNSLVRQHSRGLALEKGTSYVNAIS